MFVNLQITVSTKAEVTKEDVANVVRRLIDSGLADAAKTLEAGEGDIEAAELATGLNIHSPTVMAPPRVLVVVNGGVAETYADPGVDSVVFDWDNYRVATAETGGVPARFADLAARTKVPVDDEACAHSSAAIDRPKA